MNKNKINNRDIFARAVALISIIIALASVAVPYFQQKNLIEKQQKEELNIILSSNLNGEIKLTDHNFGENGYLIHIPWHLMLSNNGDRQLSIIQRRLYCGDRSDFKSYTGIDGGLFSTDSTPVELPIKLEQGESKSFFIYVGTLVPKNVHSILKKINGGNAVADRDAMKALGENGIDIYGNSVEYRSFDGDNFMISFKDWNKAPIHWLALSTGRGNVFYSSTSKYAVVQ